MMTTYRLKNHVYAQCFVKAHDGGQLDFISYTTRVISIWWESGKRFVECTGTYSATTRKQIGWFLKEYAPDLSYYDIKKIVGKGFVEM